MMVDRPPVPVALVDGLALVRLDQRGVADHVGEDHRNEPAIELLPHTLFLGTWGRAGRVRMRTIAPLKEVGTSMSDGGRSPILDEIVPR